MGAAAGAAAVAARGTGETMFATGLVGEDIDGDTLSDEKARRNFPQALTGQEIN
jgi:hypothetical protein